ncbi:hypothetical protein CABS01_03718 [Colletotrichum abscissum]|uniref:Uncharacterized protein n=1 Tax=Colletotrichum abscissum TaxID=1671311 RepID=A0A9Q0B480_9PEZI|nr:uncharacterized protein CABS01_03718 [Colletotrichum abscissum]KAI3556500.1 hypothetical protein CABS02_03360 [Colletotrichum abscissum]KAK1475441.1 hypothetical protein CABS01_03718 [Colletotrichum abscissum]
MRRFRLKFHVLRPDGQHYPRETNTDEEMDHDAEYDKKPEDKYGYTLYMFRVELCRKHIEPLLAAFAKSLTRDSQPSLKDAEMFMYLWWCPNDDKFKEEMWQVGDWRPSEDITSLFECLGRQEWLDLQWDDYRSTAGQDVLGDSESSPI